MPANLKNSAVATGLEKVSFHSNPKERQCQRMFTLPYNCTHFTCQQDYAQNPSSWLQLYMNWEFPDVRNEFRRARKIRDQIANIRWIVEKTREFKIKFNSASLTTLNTLTVDHNKVWNILNEVGIPDHITFLLRSLYAGQEATVRTGHGTIDWFKIGKGVCCC